eukprot:CAMPEP_0172782480 /NCGR_PEP_ID=MMETSP1074-20121228/203953_1 /TAXON_ID=2916 /ORGANISM="Ceratium fusus, Strain PA161109" /LENGTH=159 /DNA_ID=CAMNT_0013619463 /DNA_START=464 /DNA_END=943 /DNA_ORIENTATION=+
MRASSTLCTAVLEFVMLADPALSAPRFCIPMNTGIAYDAVLADLTMQAKLTVRTLPQNLAMLTAHTQFTVILPFAMRAARANSAILFQLSMRAATAMSTIHDAMLTSVATMPRLARNCWPKGSTQCLLLLLLLLWHITNQHTTSQTVAGLLAAAALAHA